MHYDHLVIGAGMSGISAASELALHSTTLLLETETAPGYHSTGRSAALFTPNFGSPVVRALNRAGHAFFARPAPAFTDAPLLQPRGALTIAAPGEEALIDELILSASSEHPIRAVSPAQALTRAPLLRTEGVAAAAFEPGVMDIDVSALQQGFLRQFRARGGTLVPGCNVERLVPDATGWWVSCATRTFTAGVVVNAAGAWAGEVATLAGIDSPELTPRRRTAIVVDVPAGLAVANLPVVDFAGSAAYFKPDAGRLMASLGDETPDRPHDVQPDDYDVAVLVDWLERQTTLEVQGVDSSWAGLRTFVADQAPVVGFDDRAPGFFWLAAQGGYGIMMAPALARLTAGLVSGEGVPADLSADGVTQASLAPGRAGLALRP